MSNLKEPMATPGNSDPNVGKKFKSYLTEEQMKALGSVRLTKEKTGALEGVRVGDFLFISLLHPDEPEETTQMPNYSGIEDDDDENDSDYEDDDEDQVEEIQSTVDEDVEQEVSQSVSHGEASDSESEGWGSEDAETAIHHVRRELCDLEIHGLYIVEGIFYEGEQVVDLTVVQLKHVMRPRGSHKPFTFQLYGEDLYGHGIKHLRETGTLINAAAPKFEWHYSKSLSFLDSTTNNLVVYHATNMDKVRKWMYVSCPARCEDGWLRTIEELNRLFRSYVSPAFVDHAIVCPVCIGTELMKMQQDLRHQLDATSYVDMEDAMAFETKLNVRRRHLGYEFEQFDERRWGYHFDDMVSEDEFDDYEEGAEFEAWNEANDPNNQPVRYRPFTNEQISMLPRNLFKYFKHAPSYRDEGKCPVCQENFKDEQHVTILPCAHAFCADGCIRQWLQRFDTCPTCRHRITADQILKPIKPITTTRDTAAAAQEEVDEEMEKKKVGGEVD